MSKLVQMQEEATRLLTTYTEYKDCNDAQIRRRVHVSLDRFLMINREAAAALLVKGLSEEIERIKAETHIEYEQKPSILQRLLGLLRKDSKYETETKDGSIP